MDEVLKRRATSFGQVADEYARGRPGYPAEAIDWVLESAPGGRVVDLGAGTGKLTRALVAPGRTVTAIEPLDEMRERLADDLPEVMTLAGSAESMPVPDASADAVFVAQAFHWFDPVPALNEIARVLTAGGMLGLIWNTRDDSEPWVAEFSRILSLPVEVASAWDWSDGRPLSQHPKFRDYRERRLANLEPYTPNGCWNGRGRPRASRSSSRRIVSNGWPSWPRCAAPTPTCAAAKRSRCRWSP